MCLLRALLTNVLLVVSIFEICYVTRCSKMIIGIWLKFSTVIVTKRF